MKAEQLDKFLISSESTVVEAMQKIDSNARGILFVTDNKQKLTGVLTDGDIRRWLIHTGDLQAAIEKFMNTAPKKIVKKEQNRAKMLMQQYSITALPVVTAKGVVSNFKVEIPFAIPSHTKSSDALICGKIPLFV